jgi:hypothetical protein
MKGMSSGSDIGELVKRTAVGTEYCPGYVIVECSEPEFETYLSEWYVLWTACKVDRVVPSDVAGSPKSG